MNDIFPEIKVGYGTVVNRSYNFVNEELHEIWFLVPLSIF